MPLTSLKDALLTEIEDIYSAEQQLVKALPKFAAAASDAKLITALETHLKETQNQVIRLEQVFEDLGEKPKAHTCKAMKGLLAEGDEILEEDAEPEVLDALIIAAAQKVEHYEIASYGTVTAWAEQLGLDEVKELLGKTLDEEETTDKKLSTLAKKVNAKADVDVD